VSPGVALRTRAAIEPSYFGLSKLKYWAIPSVDAAELETKEAAN
jgi:hypothetical protein